MLEVVACAVQLEPRCCESTADLVSLLDDSVRRAAGAGASLVVLPHLADLVDRSRPRMAEALALTAGDLARDAGVYLALGLPGEGNAGLLIGPDGKLIGRQWQTHLLPEERERGLVAGGDLLTFRTEVGRLGMLVGTDAWYPEVSRILALQGAEILLSLQAVRRPYTSWRQIAGIWQEVQQNQTFGVESCLHGHLRSPATGEKVEFEGRSAIFAPCEMTPGETGILNDAPDGAGLVLARLDFAAREQVIERYPVLGLLNPRLYCRYFPTVYRSCPGAYTAGPGDAHTREEAEGEATARVRVAAVQMRLELVGSPEEYAQRILSFAGRAAEQGARMVAFPEDVATALLGLMPGIHELTAGGDLLQAVRRVGPDARVADIFRAIAPAVQQVHEASFSEAARRFGMYVVAGSAILPDARGRMVNVAHVYGPDGQKLGEQQKCHFIPMEVAWGLETGDDLAVFDAPWGRFAAPVCMDATYFETFRILAQRGAEVVVIPSANPEEYNVWKALRGIWPRVQESQVYGIHACMVGSFMGLTLTGRSGIFAPMELTPHGDGVLAQAERYDEEAVVVADLDLEALRRLRQEEGVHRAFNLALYERYLPEIYERSRPGVRGDSCSGR